MLIGFNPFVDLGVALPISLLVKELISVFLYGYCNQNTTDDDRRYATDARPPETIRHF